MAVELLFFVVLSLVIWWMLTKLFRVVFDSDGDFIDVELPISVTASIGALSFLISLCLWYLVKYL